MESTTLSALLKLPAGDRAELALALWQSLSDADLPECWCSPAEWYLPRRRHRNRLQRTAFGAIIVRRG
jgi:hypothetical protein